MLLTYPAQDKSGIMGRGEAPEIYYYYPVGESPA
jgi:hypothetical protein